MMRRRDPVGRRGEDETPRDEGEEEDARADEVGARGRSFAKRAKRKRGCYIIRRERARSWEGSVAVGTMDGAYVSSRVAATALANGRDS